MSNASDTAELSILERRFCEAYAGECAGNGVKAAELAGYAGDYGTRAVTASRLLKKANIRDYLASLVENDPLVPARIERLRRLGQIVRGEIPEWKMTAAGEVIRLPTSPQMILAAIETLAKLGGEFVTKVAPVNSNGEDLEVKAMPLAELLTLASMKVGA